MSTPITYNGLAYSVPSASETNWASLSAYLIALSQNSQTTNKQIAGVRTALTTPVSVVSATDFAVITNLTSAGPVAVTLPTGVNGQMFAVIDGKGDAGTNNITISGTAQNINGASTYVINTGRGAALFQFSTTENQWILLSSTGGSSGGGETFPVRTALTSPVTVLASDFCVMTNLSVAGAVAVNLPAGVDGMLFAIVDAKGDSSTNNITITPASGNINGAATYVLDRNRGGVLIQYNATETEWKILAAYTAERFKDTAFTLKDAADQTKLAQFDVPAAQTTGTTRTHTLPAVSSTLASLAGTEAFTNKDYDGGTASNTSRVQLPKAATATLAGLTRKQGALAYDTDLSLAVVDDGTNGFSAMGGGSGSGEINTITNPSAQTATTGWTAGTSHTVTRDTSNSPLSPVTSTCFDIAATTTAAESSTSGVYWSTTTQPTGLRNRKLKVEFYFTTSASQTWNLGVYAGSTRMALSTDSSSATTLPSGVTGGKFTAYFDADSSTAYTIHFTRTAGSGTTHLYITNVINGPGIQAQSAAVSEWQSYTPTISNVGSKVFTTAGKWRRVGDSMEVVIGANGNATASGSAATTRVTFSLPTGYTLDLTKGPDSATYDQNFGQVVDFGVVNSGAYSYGGMIANNSTSTSTVAMTKNASSAFYNIGDLNNARVGSFSLHFVIPISEWAGNGTVNVGQNDVEYVGNSSTSSANDTTSFTYGPAGSAVPTITATTGTSSAAKRVRFQTPIQDSDRIIIQIQQRGTGAWNDLSDGSDSGYVKIMVFNGTAYGIGWQQVNTTDIDIVFYKGGSQPTGATLGSAGANYPNNASDKYRVVKFKSGQAVGFGEVAQSSSGLVKSAGQIKGTNTNDAAATGYVGEYVSAFSAGGITPAASGSNKTIASISLTAGDWDVSGSGALDTTSMTGLTVIRYNISLTNDGADDTTGNARVTLSPGVTNMSNCILPTPTRRISIAATTTVYLTGAITYSGVGTATYTSDAIIRARRVR